MSAPHPRRTLKTTSSPMTLRSVASSSSSSRHDKTSMTPQTLRKGATFHSPPSPPSDNHFVVPCLPRRSQTSLEDVVEAHKRRVALTLGDIDRSLSAIDLGTPKAATQTFRDDSLPVPQGFLNHTVDTHHRDNRGPMSPIASQDPSNFNVGSRTLRPRRQTRQSNYHPSDSGLGSSIMSASEKRGAMSGLTCLSDEQGAKSMVSASAITRSLAPHQSSLEKLPRLSERATHKIHEFILKPLLAKDSLKDFHPLVADCPRRINEKEIVCLRDLEKTLMFMAPVSDIHNDDIAVRAFAHWFSSRLKERSNTAKLYLDFCLTSIRCIQATVEYLNDRERTRPHDRPYTSGYFIDLVDQIRNYAQSVQASREKEKKGESLDEMDVESYVSPTLKVSPEGLAFSSSVTHDKEPSQSTIAGLRSEPLLYKNPDADHLPARSEEVRLYGGITKNGRPAELVRVKKDGTAVSLATGKSIKMESIEEDEKGAVMMKRSLSEQDDDDESVMRSMARRKRSASAAELAPKKCREPGCTKEFKRSCDLTKHEKTHSRPWKCQEVSCKYHEYGWPTEKELDRHVNDKHAACPKLYKCQFPPCPYQSKRESNCKQHMEKSHNWVYVRSKNNGKNRDQARVALPTPQTATILTPVTENQSTPEERKWDMEAYEPSATFNDDIFPDNSAMDFPSYPSNFHYTADPPMQQHPFMSPAESNLPYSSADSSPYLDMDTSGDFPMDDVTANFGSEFATAGADFTLYEDLYSARAQVQQLPTPDQGIFTRSYQSNPYVAGAEAISPVGQGNAMLYTPVEEMLDSFVPGAADGGFGTDFPLFGTGTGMGNAGAQAAMFGDLPSYGLGMGAGQDFLQGFYGQGWGEGDEGFEGGRW